MAKDPYAYTFEGEVRRTDLAGGPDYTVQEVSFQSPVKTDVMENNTVYALHYTPAARRKGLCILVLHGWAARKARYEKAVCASLARHGFDSCLLSLPYHMKRTPPGTSSGKYFFSTQLERSGHAFQQAIIDARCLGDIMIEGGMTLGGFGLSMGAIILNLLMGVDERFRIGVSILGGGNVNRMIWQGAMGRNIVRFLRTKGITRHHFREVLRDYDAFLEETRRTGEIAEPRWEWYLLDPLTYAHRNSPRRLLMFNGFFDFIIPRASVVELHKALGKPKLVWLPTEHFSIAFFQGMIMNQTLDFFDRYVREVRTRYGKQRI
ncbi:MAG: alpha/beta hydrolase family protein [bacterium]